MSTTQLDILSDSCLVVNRNGSSEYMLLQDIFPHIWRSIYELLRTTTNIQNSLAQLRFCVRFFNKKNRHSKFGRRHKILQIRSWYEGHLKGLSHQQQLIIVLSAFLICLDMVTEELRQSKLIQRVVVNHDCWFLPFYFF